MRGSGRGFIEAEAGSGRAEDVIIRFVIDAPGEGPGAAALALGSPEEPAILAGAFERTGLPNRASGGAAVAVGPGTVWVQLHLGSLDAVASVGPCTPDKILNRHVRPLLRGLTMVLGVPVSYFGRDWVSARGEPIAAVGFAHEARTGRAIVEAFVAVNAPFAPPAGDGPPRASLRGKTPTTLAAIRGRPIGADEVIAALRDAWPSEVETRALEPPSPGAALAVLASVEDAIGPVVAYRGEDGRLRLGGAFMASVDAVLALEDAVAALGARPARASIAEAIDAAFEGAALFGARRESLLEALDRGAQNIA